MTNGYKIRLLFLFISIPGLLYSQTGAAAFLKRGMSARSMGLGGAYTAVVNDPSAIYWNPAGLVNQKGISLQISDFKDSQFYSNFSDVNYPQASLTVSSTKRILTYFDWGIGTGFSAFTVNDIDLYTDEANYVRTFDYNESAYFLSYALGLENIQVGISYKYLYQNLSKTKQYSEITSNIKGVDFGILYQPIRFLTLGLIIRDELHIGETDYMAKSVTTGLAVNYSRFVYSLDMVNPEDSFRRLRTGLEVQLGGRREYAIRLGVRDLPIINEQLLSDRITGADLKRYNTKYSMGFGYLLPMGESKHYLALDIAVQQEISPTILAPFSRVIATTLTYR